MASKTFIFQVLRASLLISGTAIGAGMLGIPLVTFQSGFFPAAFITTLVWLFMLATGLLLLEATLWMDEGANILSMSKRFLGFKGRAVSGIVYLFLYYSLLVAYFSAGAPLLSTFLDVVFGIGLTEVWANVFFGGIFFLIVALGIKSVDRVNYLLMVGLIFSFILLLGVGGRQVDLERLSYGSFSKTFLAAPLLFGAFGYHNVIPSLTTYFKRNEKIMRYGIILGSTIPFVVYLLWQYVIIGAVPKESLEEALQKGSSVTYALKTLTHLPWVQTIGQIFSFFAIVTSMMGVAFGMVDFIGDGLKVKRKGRSRIFLCLLTFFPPFLLSSLDPSLFVLAISLAGGFGEAFLNGILPVLMVYKGRYKSHLKSTFSLPGKKLTLFVLVSLALLVVGLEIMILLSGH